MSTSKEYKAVRNCILNELHLTKEDIIKNIESLLEKGKACKTVHA